MKPTFYLLVLVFKTSILFSQNDTIYNDVEFKSINEFYIKGNTKVIGNTILSENKDKAFNDMRAINDLIKMKYVDVDNNKTTFSSSSAVLNLPKNQTEIVYAALYWSATYSLEKGKQVKTKKEIKYKGDLRVNTNIHKVKLKTPDNNYIDVVGNIIYDGYNSVFHKSNAPYSCYADVTTILKNTKTLNGTFTVANINASRGFISGGSAAGWMLYVVYKSPTETPKYITTYNGFKFINELPVTIKFKNFNSPKEGKIKASIVVAALEGDLTLKKDECAIINKHGSFKSLNSGNRILKNFFNSSITNNGVIANQRIPASKNTLGFDIASLKIPNQNNNIIDNNTTETTLKLSTKADRYYFFFTAFQTEISQDLYQTKQPEKQEIVTQNIDVIEAQAVKIKQEKTIVKPQIQQSDKDITQTQDSISKISTVQKKPKETAQAQAQEEERPTLTAKPKVKPKQQLQTNQTNKPQQTNTTSIISKPQIVNQTPKENFYYYVITNVFSEKHKAKKWENYLISRGFKPITFIGSKNWEYIAILQTKNLEEAQKTQQEIAKEKVFEKAWILKKKTE